MVQACLFAKIALQTQAEYFYAGTADTLKKVSQALSTRQTLEKKETGISGLLALAAALLVIASAELSILWFNRVG